VGGYGAKTRGRESDVRTRDTDQRDWRGGAGSGAGAFARFLGQLLDVVVDAAGGFFGHAVEEERAVEMIGFVLDTARKEAVATQHVRRAGDILKLHLDDVGPHHVAVDAGKGQATFLVDRVVSFEDGYLGIRDRHRHD